MFFQAFQSSSGRPALTLPSPLATAPLETCHLHCGHSESERSARDCGKGSVVSLKNENGSIEQPPTSEI